MAEVTSPALDAENRTGLTRREMLNYVWLVSLGIVTLQIAGITVYFALPRFRSGEFGGSITVGAVADVPPTDEPPTNYPEGRFWLSNTAEGALALYKVCTHLDCLFNWDDQAGVFVCPCHGSTFAKDGAYLSGPAPRSLDRFGIKVVSPEGEVLAETNARGDPLPISDEDYADDDIVQVDTGLKISGSPA
jgi:cytochrome b6-f complex iron-sulfur subunit